MAAVTLYCMHQLLRCHEHYRQMYVDESTAHQSPVSLLFSTLRSKCDFGDIMRYTLETSRWGFVQRHAKVGKSVTGMRSKLEPFCLLL